MRGTTLVLALGLAAACSGGREAGEGKAAAGNDQRADKQGSDEQAGAKDAAKALGGFVGGLVKMAGAQDSIDKANPYHELEDPCILVSRAEAEKYLGPLRADPWREGSTKCVYDAATGRSITLDVSYTGGKMAMKMMKAVGGLTNLAIVDESGKADTLDGDWDEVRWQYGALSALKGDVMVEVDVQASRAGPVGAAELANIALKRLPAPLHYDGAAAAAAQARAAGATPRSLLARHQGRGRGDPRQALGRSHLRQGRLHLPDPEPPGQRRDHAGAAGRGLAGGLRQVRRGEGGQAAWRRRASSGRTMAGAGADQMDQKAKSDPQAKADMEKMRATVSGHGRARAQGRKPPAQDRHQRDRRAVGRGGGADRAHVRGGQEGRLHPDGPAAAGRAESQGARGQGDEPDLNPDLTGTFSGTPTYAG